jgi:hypothetical protein
MKPGLIDPTDVFALVLMAVFSMRRINVRATAAGAFPQVPIGAFDTWKAHAVRARSLSIHACFLKFALNSVWLFGFGPHVIPPVLITGGWLIFLGWIAAMMYAWWRASSAQAEADHLGIVPGMRRAPGAAEAGSPTLPAGNPEEGASSR